jgi:hypothetical protein
LEACHFGCGSGASYPVRLSAGYTTNTSESEFSVLVICAALLFALSTGNQALAQDSGGVMNIFTAIMGAAIVNNARIEWSKLPEKKPRASRMNCGSKALRLAD